MGLPAAGPAFSAVNTTPRGRTVTRPAFTPRSGSSWTGLVLTGAPWASGRDGRRLGNGGLGLRKLIGHHLRIGDVVGTDRLADRGHGSGSNLRRGAPGARVTTFDHTQLTSKFSNGLK